MNNFMVSPYLHCYCSRMSDFSYILLSERDLLKLGSAMAEYARNGDCFLLKGDLGAGKTTFARGFISSLGQTEEIPSPTFTLLQTYDWGGGEVRHFDLYRIKTPDEVFELGWEENQNSICLVEWPQMAGPYLPQNHIEIALEFNAAGRIANISIFGNGEFKQYWRDNIKSIENERL